MSCSRTTAPAFCNARCPVPPFLSRLVWASSHTRSGCLGVCVASTVPCLLDVPLCLAERFLLGYACLAAREEARVFEPLLCAGNGTDVISFNPCSHPIEKQGFALLGGNLKLRGHMASKWQG